ncbi:MAG: glycosyltransferase [Oscillospiraceae bacterium]|jgi:glycosyltransferase involved in cell wall biosynthesis|nr:glycosyltransferase [Oscillospiraceae bacterium]
MKILLFIDQYDSANNGTTISARRFAEELMRRGHEVRVVCAGDSSDETRYCVRALRIPGFNRIIRKQGMVLARPDDSVLTRALDWADVAHFLFPFWLSARGKELADEMGVPSTAAFHVQPENITYNIGLSRFDMPSRLLYDVLHNFYAGFTHIHCPSRFIANELKRHGYEAKLHVISNGVGEGFAYRKLPKTPELAGKFVVLMIGRLSREKRQDVLIDAIRRSKYADRIQLMLAGKGPRHEFYAREGKTLPNPVSIGFYEEAPLKDLLAMTDLYVHASDIEIEAISCIEAFASGLVPVIANSAKSATPQFALDHRSLFRQGDSADLAGKIDYWIEHEEERKGMERIYAETGKEYAIGECVEKIERMFREAIADNRQEAWVYDYRTQE